MKIAILNNLYHWIIEDLYRNHAGLSGKTFAEQRQAYYASGALYADFTVRKLKLFGHEAEEFFVGSADLQRAWLRDYKKTSIVNYIDYFCNSYLTANFYNRSPRKPFSWNWNDFIVTRQLRQLSPDIILVFTINSFEPEFFNSFKQQGCKIVGQCAYPIDWNRSFAEYDLIFSSLPNFVERFRNKKLKAEYLPHAFEPAVLDKFADQPIEPLYNVTFVGRVAEDKQKRYALLESLVKKCEMHCFLANRELLPSNSRLFQQSLPPIFGYEMYSIFRQSKIGLNIHADFTESYANNLRMYEIAGMGALLLTDRKSNLSDIFKENEECVAYAHVDECIEKIGYYLEHESERQKIARAGQQRVLSDYNYKKRTELMLQHLQRL